ncbi:Uncharacterised protein [Escherichia coli]|uniref:Uncharacterized protein n=1 Tax=Escherichia coli TaxID=562 RepID=A0A2X1KCJ1_ECOLX|nr:Uncharacterised protein [Escherichia coli]
MLRYMHTPETINALNHSLPPQQEAVSFQAEKRLQLKIVRIAVSLHSNPNSCSETFYLHQHMVRRRLYGVEY